MRLGVLTRLVAAGLALAATPAGAVAGGAEPVRLEFVKMGGIPVRVSAWDVAPANAEGLGGACDARLDELEGKLSAHRTDSLVARISRGELRTVEDPDLAAVLGKAATVARRTGGAFDVTVAPLVDLWRKARIDGAAPNAEAIDAARSRVGYRLLGVDGLDVGRLADAGGALDLGGIAKGYMADAVLAVLRDRGVRRAIVEIGGDTAMYNETGGAAFRVGIRHPLRRDRLLGVIEVNGGAVVTSGNYERGFEIAGRRHGHVIDPRSGVPTPQDLLSVTVAAADGSEADAWATGLFVLGAEEGSRLAAGLGIEALFVVPGPDECLRILGTSGIIGRLQLHEGRTAEPAASSP